MLVDAVKAGIMADSNLDSDIRSLQWTAIYGLKGLGAYAHHAWVPSYSDNTVSNFFFKALDALTDKTKSVDELLGLVLELGSVNFKCMELLDKANAESYGHRPDKHFFLIGGCDGAKPSRAYYSQFADLVPHDSVILTLACGKYKFNQKDFGTIGEIPRFLDIGQCNDSYSAIKIALALAEAFSCGVNDLPLSLVLSWYEQKAVAVLLTLLSLGIKNIYLGPSLPAFVSPNVLQVLVGKFNITPISDPQSDIKKILS